MTQVITSMQLGCLPSFSTTVKCYRVLVSLSSVSKSSSQNNSSSEISSKGASLASPLIFVRLRFLFPLLVHWQTSVQIRPLAEHEQAFPVHLLTLQPHETYSSRASGADGWDIHSMERPSSTENSHCLPTGDGQSSFATNAFYHIAACLVVGSWCATIDSLVKGEDHYFSSFFAKQLIPYLVHLCPISIPIQSADQSLTLPHEVVCRKETCPYFSKSFAITRHLCQVESALFPFSMERTDGVTTSQGMKTNKGITSRAQPVSHKG